MKFTEEEQETVDWLGVLDEHKISYIEDYIDEYYPKELAIRILIPEIRRLRGLLGID